MNEFKVGDKVYYPRRSTKVHTLSKGDTNLQYKLLVEFRKDMCQSFLEDGREYALDTNPSLFHATPENHEKLEALYGVEFESAYRLKSSEEIIKELLLKQKYTSAYVSHSKKYPTSNNPLVHIQGIKDCGMYLDTDANYWKYATPVDVVTGKPIIDIDDNGNIVLGEFNE